LSRDTKTDAEQNSMIGDNGKGIPSSVSGGDWDAGMYDSSTGATKFASNDGVRQKEFDRTMDDLFEEIPQPASATKEQQIEKSTVNADRLWKKVLNFFRKYLIKKERR